MQNHHCLCAHLHVSEFGTCRQARVPNSETGFETVSQHYIRLENDLFNGKNDRFYQRLDILIVHENAYLNKNHTSMTGLLLVKVAVAAVSVPGTLVAVAGIVAEAANDMNGCIPILVQLALLKPAEMLTLQKAGYARIASQFESSE